ncbi:type VI secretion system tube protein TssD [Flavobacterium lipolyticum]|uniref:Type VI secretion system needle protein Hcp n=1 Tax=Flavobacterium lipolyticum TaxID=2893754 RepID=A0ABS8M714_9FLAO|nr:type VI secretion system tube protein TssD [Flavobacterium sp. F-126]MCC9020610.1 type VI secretion system needle protein Hcp [Flavobacterium sp. F-126]
MAFKSILEFEGNEYQVLFSKVDMLRHTDGKGAVSSEIKGGRLNLRVKSTDNTTVIEQAVNSQHKPVSGKVKFFKADSEQVMKELTFENAFIVFFSEQLDALAETPMTTEITFSAERITLGNATLDNNWAKI